MRSTPFYLHSLSNNGEHAGGASPPQPPPHPTTCGFPLRVLHRIHEGCWLKVKETGTASGAVRMCPLCRGASRSTHTFALKGELA